MTLRTLGQPISLVKLETYAQRIGHNAGQTWRSERYGEALKDHRLIRKIKTMPPSLLQNRNYLLLFSAQIISLTGSGVTTIALALFAYQIVGGASAAAVLGNALMLRILAFLLFSQLAGVLADRVNRKAMLIVADVARFGLLALFPFVTEVWQIYAMIFAINAATAFFTPTYEATIPQVVGETHYVKALSLSRVAVDVEAVAAPVIAGLLIALFGLRWVFWFDAATYLISASLVAVTVLPRLARSQTAVSTRNFLTEISHGTRVLFREPALRQALMLSIAEATAGAAAIVATVVYVKEILQQGEIAFTAVMAMVGLGSSLAALSLSRLTGRYERGSRDRAVLHGKRHRWALWGLMTGGLLLGVSLLPGILQPAIFLFGFLWMLNGVGQALIAIPSATLLAEHTSEQERGRAYAAHFAWTHAFWLVTYPAVGYATANFGAPTTFTVAGVFCVIVVGIALLMNRGTSGVHLHEH